MSRARQGAGGGEAAGGGEPAGGGPRDPAPTPEPAADAAPGSGPVSPPRVAAPLLLISIFVVATCGLGYELVAGALSTYLLGDSLTYYSLVIGLFLSAMGVGSFLSRFVRRRLVRTFLVVELGVGLAGGLSGLALFTCYAALGIYLPVLVLVCLLVGALVGLEIPLLVRILRARYGLAATLGNVLSLDYLGALAASLLFPFVLVPHLGLVRAAFLFGLLNTAVALLGLHLLRAQVGRARLLRAAAVGQALLLLGGIATAGGTTRLLEDMIYDDAVIYARTTRYQRIVVTRWRDDVRLFLDGNIQLSSVDEHRYHEALVHPALGMLRRPERVLILGGGDGMAAREVLKYPSITRVHLVDLDPAITDIFSRLPALVALNRGALRDRRVRIFNQDAQTFLEGRAGRYDAIVIDLPDPNNEALGKLYTRSFYRLVARHLRPGGLFVTQATSPFFATDAFWCIVATVRAATLSPAGGRLHALPLHANVPSFGPWGFVIGALHPLRPEMAHLRVPARHLTPALLPGLFVFPADVGPRPAPVNRVDQQTLVRLYERGYRRFNQ